MFPASTHKGQAVLGFPDVCKVPILGVPVPIAYPNISTTSTKTATKTAYKTFTKPVLTMPGGNVAGLKRHLTILHQKIMSMPGDKATQCMRCWMIT